MAFGFTDVSVTKTELEYLGSVTAGTTAASKALVLDSGSKIDKLGISYTVTSAGSEDLASQVLMTLNDSSAAGGTQEARAFKVNLVKTDISGWDSVYVADFQIDGSSVFNIDSIGNIGIGNSSLEAWSADRSVAQLGGNASLFTETTQAIGNGFGITMNAYFDGSYKHISNDEASMWVQANGIHTFRVVGVGAADATITWVDALVIDNSGNTKIEVGLFGSEITTPTPIANYWAVYGKADNALYFQDGAGTEHGVGISDYAGLHFDGTAVVTIDLTDLFHKITIFDTDMPELVSNATHATDDITIGATADYKVLVSSSFSAAAASKEFVGRVFEIGAALGGEIASITQATPGVVTTDSAHGLSNGNKVKLTGNAMVEAMDKVFIVANVASTTFELTDEEGVNVATGGYTGSDANGTVHLATETGAHWHRNSSGTAIGNANGHVIYSATAGETFEYYLKNKTDANNATFDTAALSIVRV